MEQELLRHKEDVEIRFRAIEKRQLIFVNYFSVFAFFSALIFTILFFKISEVEEQNEKTQTRLDVIANGIMTIQETQDRNGTRTNENIVNIYKLLTKDDE